MNTAHSTSAKETALNMSTDLVNGLQIKEAEKRLIQYGLNTLEETNKTSLFKRLLNQLYDAMVMILIAAASISAFMAFKDEGHEGWIDVVVILFIIMINAFLGLYQESKADRALATLKRISSPQTKVIRGGKTLVVPSQQLVPGDVVRIESGDIVAADMQLFWQQSLKVDESSLFGESASVGNRSGLLRQEDKDISNQDQMLFMGTAVTYGRAKGIVTSTGSATELGHISSQFQEPEDKQTLLQKNLGALGKFLGAMCVVACLVVLIVDYFIQQTPWEESLMIVVSLAVAAIPEGLATVVTIVLAIGMTRMSSRHAIVRNLLAVETLGCVDVICSDKTGVLTQNEMSVCAIYSAGQEYMVTGIGYHFEGQIICKDGSLNIKINESLKMLLMNAMLCNNAQMSINQYQKASYLGDPTEVALIVLSAKTGLSQKELIKTHPRIAELPFDSERKMMTTYHNDISSNQTILFTKGAPEIMLSRCTYHHDGNEVLPMSPDIRKKISAQITSFSKKSLRVMAFAYSQLSSDFDSDAIPNFEHEQKMVFIGLVGMIDPIRPEAKDAIKMCKEAGIRPVMITGDNKETALAIAKELGMIRDGEKGFSGQEIDRLTDEELVRVCEDVNIYSRVSPDHKARIVSALKKNEHVVSMTGDSVNDAMALKSADVGIAMGVTCTEVAKRSSDLILTDKNFATIVHAVEDARVIYSNIRKFVSFLLSCNIGEILVIFVVSLIPIVFFNQSGTYLVAVAPLTVIQLIWLNLVADSFPALALGREKREPDIMKQMPRRKTEKIIDLHVRWTILVHSLAIFLTVFTAFILGLNLFFPDSSLRLESARTMAFGTFVLAEISRAYSARSERESIFKLGVFSNQHMNFAAIVSVILLFLVMYLPGLRRVFGSVALPLQTWIPMLFLAAIPLIIGEIYKKLRYSKMKKEKRLLQVKSN